MANVGSTPLRELLDSQPEVLWKAIARIRDHLTHRCSPQEAVSANPTRTRTRTMKNHPIEVFADIMCPLELVNAVTSNEANAANSCEVTPGRWLR